MYQQNEQPNDFIVVMTVESGEMIVPRRLLGVMARGAEGEDAGIIIDGVAFTIAPVEYDRLKYALGAAIKAPYRPGLHDASDDE